MGVVTWPMIEIEADDALASAAHLAAADARVEKVCIWTPDKDLAQCVAGRPHRADGSPKRGTCATHAMVRAKFGVDPAFIPDYLALVGDAADGYPGIAGIGAKTAARLINQHGHLEQFPPDILRDNRERALLFKRLATLRTDAPLFADVEELRWMGARDGFSSIAERIGSPRLAERVAILRKS